MTLRTRRAVTAADVGRTVGVSQAAVSLVLAGRAAGRVSETTQRAVQAAAAELGYRPDPAARALRVGHGQAVALVVPNVANPFFAAVLQGAQEVTRRHGQALVLVEVGNDRRWRRATLEVLAAHPLAAVVFCSLDLTRADLDGFRYPVIALDAAAPDVPGVMLDVAGGMETAVRHLLGLGHRRIAHVAARPAKATFRRRAAAWQKALARAGISARATDEVTSVLSIDAARAAARPLFERHDPPTAVVCDDDVLAVGVYKAAADAGCSIPDDCSVVGFGGFDLAAAVTPELTTVALPAAALGARAVTALLAGPAGAEAGPRVQLPTELRPGASTAAPRSRRTVRGGGR